MKSYVLLSVTLSSLSWAQSTRELASVESLVTVQLIEPLRKKEQNHSRFSRAALPPSSRRLRLPSETVSLDTAGKKFVSFVVDSRVGWSPDAEKNWRTAVLQGCAYPQSKEVFVKYGAVYWPAGLMLGKKGLKPAPAGTCSPTTGELAQAPEVVPAKR